MSVKCFSITTKKKINKRKYKTLTVYGLGFVQLQRTGRTSAGDDTGRASTGVAPGRGGFSL